MIHVITRKSAAPCSLLCKHSKRFTMQSSSVDSAIEALEKCGFTVSQFLQSLLSTTRYDDHPSVHDLFASSANILLLLFNHPSGNKSSLTRQAREIVHETYRKELKILTSGDSGWHLGAWSATTKQLEDFSLEDMARDMEANAPGLWQMLGTLLGDGPGSNDENDGEVGRDNNLDTSYWDAIDEIDLEGFISGLTAERGRKSSAQRQITISMIVGAPLSL